MCELTKACNRRTIVYLYSEIMPYQAIVYAELSKLGHTVHAFYNDKCRQTPYSPPPIENVSYYPSSHLSKLDLYQHVQGFAPDLLVVCGWSSKKYLYVARKFKRKGQIPVVSPIDTQFTWRLKQIIGFLVSPVYIKTAFTHIWVPGVRQYYFARRLGYQPNQIILNSLTGNVDLFSTAKVEHKLTDYPRVFLYVGRYHKAKGLELLINVWNSINDKKGWKLVCAGNGPLKGMLQNHHDVEILDFQPQERLVEIAEKSGFFILPSVYEPWALVLQEFAAAGLPILCSDACGASPHFVINGHNGYTFKTKDASDLKIKLEHIINMSDEELFKFANHSRLLSHLITPSMSAASLLSTIE